MDAGLVLQFWVVAVLLALTPGADWAYAIAAGLRARSVVPSILGMLTGYALVVAVVAVGVGTLIASYPVALTVLTIAGALYLVYLGITTLLAPVGHVTASDRDVGDNPVGQLLRGAGVSGINPKGLLLLLALLPQFTTPDGWPQSAQMLLLGGLHILNCAVVYFTVAVLARRILRARPRATVVVTKLAGVAMTSIGAVILIERVLELFRPPAQRLPHRPGTRSRATRCCPRLRRDRRDPYRRPGPHGAFVLAAGARDHVVLARSQGLPPATPSTPRSSCRDRP